jgi:hypothetical protein
MTMIEKASMMLIYAVEQYGTADRDYVVSFGASSPLVEVTEDNRTVASLWMIDDKITVKKPN